ncbi:MAG: sodium:proline symporter [Bacteroidetes bacterium]|nr:MAG: sodium:proline symporter [Bacteroidota bacterium]
MTLATADIIVILIYLAFTLTVGLLTAKKASKGLESFFLGGRNLPWYLVGISMVATTFAADTPLAVTEIVASNGISGNWIWWNFAIGGLLTTFFFARLWRRSGVLTEVEFIELRYSGKAAAFLRGFKSVYLGLFMNILVIAWVNKALMTLLEVFFGLGIEMQFLVTGGAMLFVAVYSSLSGLLGVVLTDAVQFVVAMVGCIILAMLVLNSEEVGGIENMKAALPAGTLDFIPSFESLDGVKAWALTPLAFLAYVGVMWWSSWYPGQEPGGGGYIAQRMMSAKNEKHAVYATLFFQLAHYCLRPWPWIMVGLAAMVLYPDIMQSDNPGQGYVMAMKEFLPDGVRGLLLVAFLAAYMSTISTQLNWGASYLTNDLYKRFFAGKSADNDKKNILVSRLITLGLMLVGLTATAFVDQIKDVWLFLLECGAGLGLVLILRWYWWRVNVWSEIAATLTPFVLYGIILLARNYYALQYTIIPEGSSAMKLVEEAHPNLFFPNSFFFTVLITTVVWLLVTFLTKPVEQVQLQKFYDKVKPMGSWRPFNANMSQSNRPLIWSFFSWLLSVVFTYSVLFATGKFLLGFQQEALYFGLSAGISLLLFLLILKWSKLFD